MGAPACFRFFEVVTSVPHVSTVSQGNSICQGVENFGELYRAKTPAEHFSGILQNSLQYRGHGYFNIRGRQTTRLKFLDPGSRFRLLAEHPCLPAGRQGLRLAQKLKTRREFVTSHFTSLLLFRGQE